MRLYTSYWANRELSRLPVVPVGISRGAPKFRVRYRYRRLMELAPAGWMLGIKSDERFEKVYVAQLEKIGVEKVHHLLTAISEQEGGKALALLCYEDVHAGQVCHRRMWARWWYEKTGQEVPELGNHAVKSHSRQRPVQDTLW